MRKKQLTLAERYHISTLLKRGYTQQKIAEHIGVHPSTISREISRNRDEVTQVYEYSFSHSKYEQRQQSKRKYTVFTFKIKSYKKTTVLEKSYI